VSTLEDLFAGYEWPEMPEAVGSKPADVPENDVKQPQNSSPLRGEEILGVENNLNTPQKSSPRSGEDLLGTEQKKQLTDDDAVATATSPLPASKAASIPLTREDQHNAEYFEYAFGQNVRYDHVRGRWYLWHKGQHHWREDDHEEVKVWATNAAVRRAKAAIDMGDRDKLKIAMGLFSLAKKNAALDHLRFHSGIAVGQGQWDQNADLFGVRNGVLELRSGTLRAGSRLDNMTKASPVAFDPAATCPRWLRFLDEVFVTPEMIAYVRSVCGYCLTGYTTEQAWWLLYGTGANGKSVFVSVLEAILGIGQYYEVASAEAFTASRFGSSGSHNIAQLRSARLVVASEVPERASFDGSRIKSLTGSDPVTAAAKYENNVTFVPQLKLMMLVNHLPTARDDSQGFWRRLHTIPFERTFYDAAADPHLADTLRTELPGILNWMLSGAVEWFRSGLSPEPTSSTALKAEYKAESDPLAMFIHECILVTMNDADTVGAREVYSIYLDWCSQNRHAPMNETNFGRSTSMKNLGLGRKRTTQGVICLGIRAFSPGSHPVSGVRTGSSSHVQDVSDVQDGFGWDEGTIEAQ